MNGDGPQWDSGSVVTRPDANGGGPAAPAAPEWDTGSVVTRPPSEGQGSQPLVKVPSTPQLEFHAAPQGGSIEDRMTRWAENVANDIEYGTDITGVGTVLKKMGAHGVYMGNSHEVGDFMASLPLGLLKVFKGLNEVGGGHYWQGSKDTVSGGLQAATIPGGFIAPETAEVASAAGGKALEMTGDAARAAASKAGQAGRAAREMYTGEAAQAAVQKDLAQGIRSVFQGAAEDRGGSLPIAQSIRDVPAHLADMLRQPEAAGVSSAEQAAAVQDELQKGIRGVIKGSAQDANLSVEDPQSIRDAALKLSDALYDKSSGIYKQMDEALGGTRFQSFRDKIYNITKALRNVTGTDPEEEGRLVEKLNAETDAMGKALEELKGSGIDQSLIDEATAAFRKHKGIEELSNHIQKTTRGLRPELQQAGQEATPERVQAEQLEPRINAMYNSGTLQDALGESHAQDLLRHVDRAQVTMPKTPAALRQQSDAIDQVTAAIRKSADGMRPEDVKPGRTGTPESLKIEQLFSELHNLHDDGVLAEALGSGRARDLLNEVDAAKIRSDDVLRRVKRAKTITKVVGAGLGLETARRTAEHLIEGTYYSR